MMSFPQIDKALNTNRGVSFYWYKRAMTKLRKILTKEEIRDLLASLSEIQGKT